MTDQERLRAAVPTDITLPMYVSATTSVITWSLTRWIFHAGIPPEIYVWVQLTVPIAMGRLAAGWTMHAARRRPRRLPGNGN